jgi:hypothetical protein
MSPPTRRKGPAQPDQPFRNYTDTAQPSANPRQAVHDALAAIRRCPYKPSTSLRASGYREGCAACLRWVQSEFDQHLDEIGHARLGAVVARSEAAA